jgi:DNA-binding NarL/FixJ family response regulator
MKSDLQMKIKVLLVDDHPLVLAGVSSSLLKQQRFEIIGEAASGPEAISQAKECSPDVVVMDITMPGMNGLEATKCLRAICPQSKVLFLTVHEKKGFIREMIQAGARGYVRKNSPPGELAAAIECVHRGEVYFMPDVAQAFFKEYVLNAGKMEDVSPKRLSKREHEILGLIVEGLANKEIALRLELSVRTAEKHRQRIMEKLGIHRATELVRVAITRGFVKLNPEPLPFMAPARVPERRTL